MTASADIERHRLAMLRIVARLFDVSGVSLGQPARLSRILRGTMLFFLRPLESATRRLIYVHARELIVTLRASRTKPSARGNGMHTPGFPLFDRRKSLGTGKRQKPIATLPRITLIGYDDDPEPRPVPKPNRKAGLVEDPKGRVDAGPVLQRLLALKAVLEDLSKPAERLARVLAPRKAGRTGPVSPMRPGHPPGHRTRKRWDVHEILTECHQSALEAMAAPDSS